MISVAFCVDNPFLIIVRVSHCSCLCFLKPKHMRIMLNYPSSKSADSLRLIFTKATELTFHLFRNIK